MYEQFGQYLLQNRLQRWYIERVISNRNQYSDAAFTTTIRQFFPHASDDFTPLELVYHGLRPLYATGKILLDTTLKFDDVELERDDNQPPSDQVIAIYDQTLEVIEKGLKQWTIDTIEGELEGVRGDEEEFTRRLGIVSMHAINHIAQAISFQGLICTELINSPSQQ